MLDNLLTLLEELSIQSKHIDHAPVYTSEQARALVPRQQAASAKNLFLKDKKGKNHYLLVFDDRKKIDFDQLAAQIGSSRLSLASPARLNEHLGVEPGAVSLLALINDPSYKVQLLIDREVWNQQSLQCHPLINTATLVIAMPDVKRFLDRVGHAPLLVDVE